MSLPEVLLWTRLRSQAGSGIKWRRQHPLGVYVADFYCYAASLVVEIDGAAAHAGKQGHDRTRDAWMRRAGLRVLRIRASDVLENPDAVAARVQEEAANTLNAKSLGVGERAG